MSRNNKEIFAGKNEIRQKNNKQKKEKENKLKKHGKITSSWDMLVKGLSSGMTNDRAKLRRVTHVADLSQVG